MCAQLDLLAGGVLAPGHHAQVYESAHWRGGLSWFARCSCSWRVGGYPRRIDAERRVWLHAAGMGALRERGQGDG